ncbi:hypothetical protein D8O01_19485, partial [Acinetobacter baumannii]
MRHLARRRRDVGTVRSRQGTSPRTERGAPSRGSATLIDLDLSRYDRIASRFR